MGEREGLYATARRYGNESELRSLVPAEKAAKVSQREDLNITTASEAFQVSRRSTQRAMESLKQGRRAGVNGRHPKLYPDQCMVLIDCIRDAGRRRAPPKVFELCELVKSAPHTTQNLRGRHAKYGAAITDPYLGPIFDRCWARRFRIV